MVQGAKRRLYSKYTYMVTIAKHQVKDYVQPGDIYKVMEELKWRFPSLHFSVLGFELMPKYNQLHCHAIAELNEAVFYRKNSSIFGFRIQWSPVRELAGAIQYCMKDAYNKYAQQQILDINRYTNGPLAFAECSL